ncbi:MAG: hypothetical protein A2X86_20105 [Bdellovibrionales bacterium GWA2_49_15]|nr:MAG: hypothetical protein A2X86_20105 [Bdellovibrionales bacterium GWA2_49_15]HAZ11384.1 hypothetical protein [Bdellovibrionales bacterium]
MKKIIFVLVAIAFSTTTYAQAELNFSSTFKIFKSQLPQFFPGAGPSEQLNCYLDIYPSLVNGVSVNNDAREEFAAGQSMVEQLLAQGIPEGAVRLQGALPLNDKNIKDLVQCPFGDNNNDKTCPLEEEPMAVFVNGVPFMATHTDQTQRQVCIPEYECAQNFLGTAFTTADGTLGCEAASCSNGNVILRGDGTSYSCITPQTCESYGFVTFTAPWGVQVCGMPQ